MTGLPRLNEPAPDFHARTTHGDRSLADYRGKWLILFSHPSDFTPVCTTEFIGFAKHADEFAAMNCELLGLSIDSIFSHLAWTRNIKEKFGVEIPFPIIEDLKMEVAQAYGMIHPGAADTSAVRATFLIDPEGKLRAMVYYPMSNGRSIEEFVRLRALRRNIVVYARNSAEARQAWIDDPTLDAWIIWGIWQVANPDLADVVEVEEPYRIYRDAGAVVTETGRQDADAQPFLDFLKSDEGAAIFARWGWRTGQP